MFSQLKIRPVIAFVYITIRVLNIGLSPAVCQVLDSVDEDFYVGEQLVTNSSGPPRRDIHSHSFVKTRMS